MNTKKIHINRNDYNLTENNLEYTNKWEYMLFEDIIGQEKLKKRLIQTVNDNHISHAQLFLGPEGSGNLALAIAYAQYICCENKKETDSCGVCISCQKYQKLIHPDLHFVFPVFSTENITQDPVSDNFIHEWRTRILENPYLSLVQWYEFIGVENKQGMINRHESYEIIKKLSLKTFESEHKIMIIWMPEKMNISASNKLLKTIEEPPPRTIFLLVSENLEQIIPTILSRTQIIKIPKIEYENLFKAIEKKYDFGEKEINNIVHLAYGNYLKALNIIHSTEENSYNFNMFTQIMRLCYGRKIVEIITWVDKMATIGRERQKSFLTYALRMIRENIMLNLGNPDMVFLTENESAFSRNFSPYINENNVYEITNEFNKTYRNIELNANNKIVFLDLSLKLIKLIK